MPYIPQSRRRELDQGEDFAENVGELNYQITKTVQGYLSRVPRKYEAYNSAMGALECAKLELYRRQVAEYEDQKKVLHGDVYA
jgi:hypothetical protein